ncbi:MAG: CoA transferase [Pseudomonadota bacterium]
MDSAALEPLQQLADAVGSAFDLSPLTVDSSPTAIAGPLPIADIASATFAALGLALEAFHHARGGPHQQVEISRRHASLGMRSADFLEIDGVAPKAWDPLTGYYKTGDQRWVYLHANFPHHRDGLLTLLGCAAERAAVVAAVQTWDAEPFEQTASDAGLCVGVLRTREAWWQHPQRIALDEQPVIALAEQHARAKRQLAVGEQPLSGVRVLDLSRVLAGPMAGRALAEHGATVLRVGADHLPVSKPLTIDTGYAKQSCHLDLRTDAGKAELASLLETADVLIDGFRPGALDAHGLSRAALQARYPDLIHISLSAYSDRGPWAGRRGFDSLVQAPTGLARAPADGSDPVRLPCQPLDYLTGCLGAFAAVHALTRRQTEGVACSADLALARTANWLHNVHDLIGDASDAPGQNTPRSELGAFLMTTQSPFGTLESLAPPLTLSRTPWRWRAPQPLGSHAPVWPT